MSILYSLWTMLLVIGLCFIGRQFWKQKKTMVDQPPPSWLKKQTDVFPVVTFNKLRTLTDFAGPICWLAALCIFMGEANVIFFAPTPNTHTWPISIPNWITLLVLTILTGYCQITANKNYRRLYDQGLLI